MAQFTLKARSGLIRRRFGVHRFPARMGKSYGLSPFRPARAAAEVAQREAGSSWPHRKTDERLLTSQRADLGTGPQERGSKVTDVWPTHGRPGNRSSHASERQQPKAGAGHPSACPMGRTNCYASATRAMPSQAFHALNYGERVNPSPLLSLLTPTAQHPYIHALSRSLATASGTVAAGTRWAASSTETADGGRR